MTFTRPIPSSPGADLDVWRGQGSVAHRRVFARPSIESITATFQ